VLEIYRAGGFVPHSVLLTTLPLFALYGDGTVVTQGVEIAIYPGPALPPLRRSQLTEDGVQALLQRARGAGLLDGDAEYTAAQVTDMPTTIFTLHAEGDTTTVSVYALDFEPVAPDASQEERDAREQLRAFQSDALAFWSWLPSADVTEQEEPYAIERLQIVSQLADQAVDGAGVEPDQQDWPLVTPLADFGVPYRGLERARCAVVEGDDLAGLLPLLQQATDITRWNSADQQYVLYLRPILPHEDGCS
jgi:hypothetical protein